MFGLEGVKGDGLCTMIFASQQMFHMYSGKSYKQFTLVIYESRVVICGKLRS